MNDLDAIGKEWYEKDLRPVVGYIARRQEQMAHWRIARLKPILEKAMLIAFRRLARKAGYTNIGDAPPILKAFATANTLGALNSALPIEHPYIFVAVTILDEPGNLHFACMQRNRIPGMHDCLHQNLVPFVTIPSRNDIENCRFSVRYGYAEDDPFKV